MKFLSPLQQKFILLSLLTCALSTHSPSAFGAGCGGGFLAPPQFLAVNVSELGEYLSELFPDFSNWNWSSPSWCSTSEGDVLDWDTRVEDDAGITRKPTAEEVSGSMTTRRTATSTVLPVGRSSTAGNTPTEIDPSLPVVNTNHILMFNIFACY